MVTPRADVAADAVAAAFAITLSRQTAGSEAANEQVQVALLAAARRAAIDLAGSAGDAPTPAAAVSPAVPRLAVVRDAFIGLPERLRSIVWLVDVEGCWPDDAARVLGLDPTTSTGLADRARLGLCEQLLQASTAHESSLDCRRTIDRLTAYIGRTLAERDSVRVRAHLDDCSTCRDRLAEIDDVVPLLRSTALPVPDSLLGSATERWTALLVRDAGPLRIALPGGDPMPAWAQRAFAGTVAAIIGLGITGATLVASRSRSATEASRPTPAGESALSGSDLPEFVPDGSGFLSLSAAGSPSGNRTREGRASWDGALPRSSDPVPIDGGALGRPIDDESVPSDPGPDATTPPPPPPPAEPLAQATVGAGGVVTVTGGDECTGAQALATTIGCQPPTTDGPLTLDTEGTAPSAIPLAP